MGKIVVLPGSRLRRMNAMKTFLAASLFFVAGLAQADITYTVTVQKEPATLLVQIEVPVKGPQTKFEIPKWDPGSYNYDDHYKNVDNLVAVGPDGTALTVQKSGDTTWVVDSKNVKSVRVTYGIKTSINADRTHYSGTATYLYVVDRKEEKCKLNLVLPGDWKSATGLQAGKKPHTYEAPTYDVLADNPVSVGKYEEDDYVVGGVPHQIVYHSGDATKIDREKVKKSLTNISESHRQFWGKLPFKKYVWHVSLLDSADGGWGLEHLSSVQVGMATGYGLGTQGVMSHEYFHAWNVKRIRSKVLGPFNYQELPKTGALWWLEGVTDYYAYVVPVRTGEFSVNHWMRVLTGNIDSVKRNAARLEISPYESSYRVGDASGGRGNSSGFRISYYDLGHVAGMCLDLELRSRTGGKRSLDDVVKALFELCKNNKPGFEEDEIRKQLIRFGGPEMGPIYDQWVMKPGELPVNEQLAKAGLAIQVVKEPTVETGIGLVPGTGGARVTSVSEALRDTLAIGDVVVTWNDLRFDGPNAGLRRRIRSAMDTAKVGTPISIEFMRGTETKKVTLTPVAGTRDVRTIIEKPDATPEQLAVRNGWQKHKA
jgi:predicted metalloprotease with PDZ domain